MKILLLEWKSFGNEDIIEAFEEKGHIVQRIPFSNRDTRPDDVVEQELTQAFLTCAADFVFSFNYFPIVSLACKKTGMRYVSWVYDSPYVMLYSYTVIYPGNYIFVFDKELYLEFRQAGIQTVHYLPMAANVKRLSAMHDWEHFHNSPWCTQSDIAFVGSLYTEKHQFFQRLDGISPYTRGYLDGLIATQKKVYGYNFIQEVLSPEIIEDLMRVLPMHPDPTGVESVEYLYAQYVVNRQITATERSELLSAIGKLYRFDLYTPDSNIKLPGCINHGPVDYYDMAPYVFKSAKINLNITLRSIKSGIPLRAFDIMGSGGFLLTNYQADFDDYFLPGEDYVVYDSTQSLLDAVSYYLNHDSERTAIAECGFRKIASQHTYSHRIDEILSYL